MEEMLKMRYEYAVIYQSSTGNTEKIAKAVYNAIESESKQIVMDVWYSEQLEVEYLSIDADEDHFTGLAFKKLILYLISENWGYFPKRIRLTKWLVYANLYANKK